VSGGRGLFDVCWRFWSAGGWSCSFSRSDSTTKLLNPGEEIEKLRVAVVVEREPSGDDRKRRDMMRRRARREADEAAMDARREERRSSAKGGRQVGLLPSAAGLNPSQKPSCQRSGAPGRCMGWAASPQWAGLHHHGGLGCVTVPLADGRWPPALQCRLQPRSPGRTAAAAAIDPLFPAAVCCWQVVVQPINDRTLVLWE
jgi:hypothetical protein